MGGQDPAPSAQPRTGSGRSGQPRVLAESIVMRSSGDRLVDHSSVDVGFGQAPRLPGDEAAAHGVRHTPPPPTVTRTASRAPQDRGEALPGTLSEGPAFLELFAGAGGLSAAVARLGLPVHRPVDVRAAQGEVIGLAVGDLLVGKVYAYYLKLARSGRVRWLHGGPPCKTFTRARRNDSFGAARTLRSELHPAGLPGVRDRRVKDANMLVQRLARLARVVHRCGGYWSIENPARSYIWLFHPLVSLAKLAGAKLIIGDQCLHGGLYRKPTGWLTTAPFLQVLEGCCPGPPSHPRHPALQGWAVAPDGRQCWLTELAAEYPQDLCDVVAREYGRYALAPL